MKDERSVDRPIAWGQFTRARLERVAADERLAELVRLAEVGAGAEWLRELQRMCARRPERRLDEARELHAATRDEARERGVALVDIVRRNAAIGYLESKGHAEPTEHAIESVVMQLKRAGGTPAIQKLRTQVRSTCRRLCEK